ncbi:MAG: hypothetical protein M1818_006108 [Claussenomyces sp. TS43310]|nr:MAG: hypothetical protein M1818_006108 [Claussenomyces sp. TS43310]
MSASAKLNLGAWTVTQLRSAANVTQYAPSAKDLLLAGPRMGMKLGSFFFAIPYTIDDVLGGRVGQHHIPEATGSGAIDVATIGSAANLQGTTHVGPDVMAEVEGGVASRLSIESARSFGNIFQYSTSRWAIACIVMAIVLNRTNVYASTRRNLTLGWKVRLFLRIVPILLFAFQTRSLLQSIQCQTSPEFGMLRWGNTTKTSELMFTQNGGFLHTISSTLLLQASDYDSCRAVNMVLPDSKDKEIYSELSGSMSRLWPLFETFCFSHFIETLSCAVQGRQVAPETGMSLFEHSLAFAEAEAAVSSTLGWGPFGEKSYDGKGPSELNDKVSELAIKRSMIMKRVNTPPEVLLVGFLSGMNHLTSHILGIFNLQNRLRLASTALWGLCFMATIICSIMSFSVDDLTHQALLRFPTVCVIGFIPHVLVFCGILLCSTIYGLALILTALAPPPGSQFRDLTFVERLTSAHENMQANVSLANIRVSMHMDFYQALLKIGYNALTIASEAVYLNESSEVQIKDRTWLEEDRLREIEDNRALWLGPAFRRSQQDMTDDVGLIAVKDEAPSSQRLMSGFAKERTAQDGGKIKPSERIIRDGIGATERSGRWIMAFELFIGIARLISSWSAAVLLKVLTRFGVRRPQLLAWFLRRPTFGTEKAKTVEARQPDNLEFWLLGPDGELVLPKDEHVDVEAEMRRRLKGDKPQWDNVDEQKLQSNLYGWWLNGGWWGSDDSSGTFVPNQDLDEDTTSITSTSTHEWESEDADSDDVQRTPTQVSHNYSRDSSSPLPDNPLNSAYLAQLLHPRNLQQREEAHALAAHLSSDEIVTRSRYRDLHKHEKTRILTSARHRSSALPRSLAPNKLTPEEEGEILEHLLLSRRAGRRASSSGNTESSVWAEGASGMGGDGPQCVVCQSAPRSIIVWPCRCLSLCDDCRVTLAMNNFDKCVCCRRDVNSFSRIFVP